MESWTPADVPRLPAGARALSLYNSSSRRVEPTLVTGSTTRPARMYVCGITPYDAAHLGHAATMITFDLVYRMWRDNGHEVRYVQNVTDVDDPLLERAARDGEDWVVLGMRETALFREDMEALRVIPPTRYVGAVESIPSVVKFTQQLLDSAAAYRIDDGTGDVYFPVSAAARFGYESGLDRATMVELSAERGGDPERAGKRDPLDPLLWRGQRPDEPSWSGGSLGPGRPGWHIECAAIALELLGARIDVQGGGNDLVFPHHEMSAAHAETLTGEHPFAAHYVHAGMIGLAGQKMSKSQGNLLFVSKMRGDQADHRVDPMAIRLGLLAGHYRADRDWTDAVLAAGVRRLGRWRDAVAQPAGPPGESVLAAVRRSLANDLDTGAALAAVDAWAADSIEGVGGDTTAPRLVAETVDALLGVKLGV